MQVGNNAEGCSDLIRKQEEEKVSSELVILLLPFLAFYSPLEEAFDLSYAFHLRLLHKISILIAAEG